MSDFTDAFAAALRLILGGDPELIDIVLRSLAISLSATILAGGIGLPFGAMLAVSRFPGRRAVVVALNALMGLPPVVVGLVVYLLLSRAGPLGPLGLLFTPAAMVVAQACLIAPIIAALTRQTVEDLHADYDELFRSLRIGRARAVATLLWDGRFSLITALLAGFGRASAEVGAVIIVGGNIDKVTRVMTTAIALETSRGDLSLALGLGLIVLCLSLAINAGALALGQAVRRDGRAAP